MVLTGFLLSYNGHIGQKNDHDARKKMIFEGDSKGRKTLEFEQLEKSC